KPKKSLKTSPLILDFTVSLSLSLKTNDANLARVHRASISCYKPSLKTNL
ncbi:hypothetical protein PanWU01x14_261160, partial [Parasponia andersonii]